MGKGDKKFIFLLLLLILILSSFLVYRIKSESKYDEKLYHEIYKEYDEIFETNQETSKEEYSLDSNRKDNKIYYRADAFGNKYRVIGKISIPKIKIKYPIIYETSNSYLKIAPTKLFGPDVNEVGNLCIVGHNYRNDQFFSRLSELNIGDNVYMTTNNGNNMTYIVYDKYEISENDMECTSQDTNGNIELTLITCTAKKKNRLVVKCKAIT